MDGIFPRLPERRTGRVLQRFLTDRIPERRALYWRDPAADAGAAPSVSSLEGGALQVSAGGSAGFDTYFNAFFEAPWRRHTTVRTVILQIAVSGTALLRVHRHSLGRKVLVAEHVVTTGTNQLPVPTQTINFRQHGMLTAELCAVDGPFTFLWGHWLTPESPGVDAGLAAVFCTFNREAEIASVLQALGSDPAALDRIARIIVVNQGRPDLLGVPDFADAADCLGEKLTVIEQQNFGGAGGFSRGLLAAMADPNITHAVLLDDDLELEPDSLLRMAAFFSYCEQDVVLGGHMLDLLNPTRLYEAGAVISEEDWNFLPQHFQRDISAAGKLEELSHPYAVHYNGWWCCGVPLSVLREQGMPLPCFIRGDDLEFGLRLHQRGVPTVPMPGIAVWHEPFYLKLGGWQLYYETRNMLVTAALHKQFDRAGVTRRMARQIIVHLLTYRYYGTALILRGIRDFLAGPSVMREPPLRRHASLMALRQAHEPAFTRRETVHGGQPLEPIPSGRLRIVALLAWLLVRNAVLPSCKAPARLMTIDKMHWLTVRKAGHFVAETWWDNELPTFRRCRDQHRILLREAIGLVWRLFWETPRKAAEWQQAAPTLTSVAFWHDYLGVPPSGPGTAPDTAAAGVRPAMAASA